MASQLGRFYISIFKAHWWPTAIFLSAVAATLVYGNLSIELSNASKPIAGIASFHLVDIGKRVSSFYYLIGAFSATFIFLSWLFSHRVSKHHHFSSWLKRSQYISLFGLVNLFTSLVGSNHSSIVELLLGLLLSLIIIEFISWKFSIKLSNHTLIRSFCYSLILALILKFGAVFILLIDGRLEFLWLIWIIIIPLSILMKSIPKSFDMPWAIVPILTIISSEITWVYRESIELNRLLVYLVVFTVFLIIWLLLSRSRKLKPKKQHFYAIILIAVALLSSYSPSITNNPEIFEFANPANAVLRTFQFGEIPVIDYLNSHLLSELVFRFLYVVINGYSGNSAILIYDFLEQGLFIFFAYIFLKRITGKAEIAFFICLFFPWLTIIIPPVFSISLISILIIEWTLKTPNTKNFLALISWCIFLLLWRIDLGASNLIATLAVVCGWMLIQRKWLQLKKFLLSMAIVAGIIVLLFIVFELSLASDLLSNFHQALGYFAAGQAHGFEKLSKEINTNFSLHHFIFPLITAFIGIVTLYSFHLKKLTFNQISIAFLSLFILFNLQRGLVRHGFMEHTDLHLSSFFFLLVPLFTGQLVLKKFKHHLIVIVAIILITFTKVTPLKGYRSTLLSADYHVYRTPEKNWLLAERLQGFDEFADEQFSNFKKFMNVNFDNKATFLDMSNSPAWYYYLNRPVPSYFNQYLQNTVTHQLQKINIVELQKLKVPVAIYSRWPDSWWDRTDRVPNALRYFEISQHLFDNYKPYAVINKRYVWIKNEIENQLPRPLTLDSIIDYKEFNLLNYPLVCQQEFEPVKLNCNLTHSANQLRIPTQFQHKTYQYLKLQLQATSNGMCELAMIKDQVNVGTFHFSLKKGSHEYFIPLCTMYNWLNLKPQVLTLNGKVQFDIQFAKICDKE